MLTKLPVLCTLLFSFVQEAHEDHLKELADHDRADYIARLGGTVAGEADMVELQVLGRGQPNAEHNVSKYLIYFVCTVANCSSSYNSFCGSTPHRSLSIRTDSEF
jgi:hypothetical protein